MLFKNVLGQSEIKRKLIDSVQRNTVSHAQLFLGSLGHGGLALALAYSQYLNCENPGMDDACAICSSCVKAAKLIHPDIHFSFPFPRVEKREKCDDFIHDWRAALLENPYLDLFSWMAKFESENKQPHIPVKECHDIIRKLSLKAYESSYKILILWLPEYLGNNGNTLLKIIEEPPEKTVFLLIGESRDAVIPTILSRTQILHIPHIEYAVLSDALKERFNLPDEDAFKLAMLTNGDFIESAGQIERSYEQLAGMFCDWMEICLPSDANQNRAIALYQWIEKFAPIGRENQKSFMKYALHFLRESLLTGVTGKSSQTLNQTENALAQKLAALQDEDLTDELYRLINDAHYHIERNANPKILMMSLSLKIAGKLKVKNAVRR